MTMYLLLTLVGNGHQLNLNLQYGTSMIENGRLGRSKVKNEL